MTFILVLFLASTEIVSFQTTKALCFETLEAHRQGSVVVAWDREGRQWPAENVWCLEEMEQETQETPTS